MRATTKLWIGLAALAVIAPVGLYLPARLGAGAAWGEWGTEEIGGAAGYIPAGLERLSKVWHAVMPDYAFKGWESKGMGHLTVGYIVSAVLGIALCAGVAVVLGRILARKDK